MCRPTPIRPPVVNRQWRPVTPAQALAFASSASLSFVSGFRFYFWLQALSLHQTPIGDPRQSLLATPCPRNTSVPSLVQSNSGWLFVQLAPGSRKGQSSQGKRTLALRKGLEGRWVPNQSDGLPGIVQEAITGFAVLAAIPDLRISFGPHHAGFTLGSVRSRLQLDGRFTHPRSVSCSAPRSASCRKRAPGAA